MATLFKHLRFSGVEIVTLSEGEITELHVGLKGTMNALFLKDLAAKTHRGIRGRVEKGKSGGGLCYGYDVVKHTDAEGEPNSRRTHHQSRRGRNHPPGLPSVRHRHQPARDCPAFE